MTQHSLEGSNQTLSELLGRRKVWVLSIHSCLEEWGHQVKLQKLLEVPGLSRPLDTGHQQFFMCNSFTDVLVLGYKS